MSTEDKGPDPILDRAISEIRDESIPAGTAESAAGRVWARLSAEAPAVTGGDVQEIRACADFRRLIPAWREGRLSPARVLLLEDHLHECPACRKASAGAKQPVVLRPVHARPAVWKWAMAASVLAAVGVAAWMGVNRLLVPSGARATVASLDGTLYRVSEGGRTPLVRGAALSERENVRTARDSGAVLRLRDGSLVEMRERTELAVSERSPGVTIRLAAGSIIVQAAKQRSRHLYVATDDCLVSVTGTVFSVNRGIRGSRVAVVEGEVHVRQGDQTKVLHPGDQVATSTSLTPVPVREEVAWSRNADQYIAVLNELAKLRQKLEALPGPGVRTSTRLAALAPANTVFYAAIPNLGPTLADANRIFHEQLAQSEPLRQWWAQQMESKGGEAKFNDVLARVQTFSSYLGPEITVAFAAHDDSPVLMAEVTRDGLREFLGQQGLPVRIVDDPMRAAPVAGHALYVYFGPNLVAASGNLQPLQQVAAAAAGRNAFTSTPFYNRIAQAYQGGVEWLLCADLKSMVGRSIAGKPASADAYRQSGFDDAQYLVLERKAAPGGQTENRAVLTFAQARHGVASWLAAPAAVRALDFVSPDATLAVAAAIKSPRALVDDAFAMASSSNSDFGQRLGEFEAVLGVNVREDLARPLGGEFAFALDGPMLPVPSWKLVLEVYDPARFQQAMEKLITHGAAEAAKHPGAPQFRLDKEEAGGRTYYILRGTKLPFEPQYVYDGGFLIAAPNRDLLLRAMEYRTTGYMLARSAKFTSMLPSDRRTDFSAVVYHTLGTALAPLASSTVLSEEQRKSLEAAAAAAGPALVVAYGEQDRIELASSGTFFGLRLEQLLKFGGRRGRSGS